MMLLLLTVISILHTPTTLQTRPPSCGEVCHYEEGVQFADCSDIGLQEVPTKDGCESARFLNLRYNNIAFLLEDHMLGNRGAQHLDFSFNNISNVEPRSFAGCNSVNYLNLYLSSNQIAVLRNETFNECEKSLQQLHLDRNKIAVIENGALKNLTRLAHLFLGDNNLQNLEATTFQDLHSLESLYLNSNRLTFLPGDLFATLSRLKHLDLSGNSLIALGDDIFNQCCQLIAIVLFNNQLTNVPSLPRRPCLDRLQALDIRNNSITDASNLTQYINATKNLLIDGNPFHCDCNLENLRIWVQQEVTSSNLKCFMPSSGEGRDIQTLPALCPPKFSPATSLPAKSKPPAEQQECVIRSATNGGDKNEQLNGLLLPLLIITTSPRVSITQILFTLLIFFTLVIQAQPPLCGEVCYYDGEFQIADCSGIGLQEVPAQDGCESARLLDLSYNDIASLHQIDMIGNRGAQHLDFSFNSISNVEPRSFSGSNSVIYLNLYLSSNQIAVLQNDIFSECEQSLQQLHLDRNKIAIIENEALKRLSKLVHLFLGHNSLQSLNRTIFQDLHSLQSLYLNSNRLTSLPGDLFATLSRLKHLDLSSNNLVLLGDETFHQHCQLMTVVLANNRLRNIPHPSRSPCLNALQALDIRNNNITDATNITHYIGTTEKLFIDDNPFHCDCNLENLRIWVQQEVTSSELKCFMPSSGESRDIQTLPALCPTKSPDTTVVLTQITSHEEEQIDIILQAARLQDMNSPTLPTSSRTVSQTNESPDENENSWTKPAILVCILIFLCVIILSLLAKCLKGPKSTVDKGKTDLPTKMVEKTATPSNVPISIGANEDKQKALHLTNDSSSEECTIDMISYNGTSPVMANTVNNQNGKTIADDYMTSSHDNDFAEGEPLIGVVDDKHEEVASLELTKDREGRDDLRYFGQFSSNSLKSTPKHSRVDMTGLRKRTPQSTNKMIPDGSPHKITNITNSQNAPKIGGDSVRLSDKNDVGSKNTSMRRLDNQYEAPVSDEVKKVLEKSDDLGIVGELPNYPDGEDLVAVNSAKTDDYDKENRSPNKSLYQKGSKKTPQNQEKGTKVRLRVTPQKRGQRKLGGLEESDRDILTTSNC